MVDLKNGRLFQGNRRNVHEVWLNTIRTTDGEDAAGIRSPLTLNKLNREEHFLERIRLNSIRRIKDSFEREILTKIFKGYKQRIRIEEIRIFTFIFFRFETRPGRYERKETFYQEIEYTSGNFSIRTSQVNVDETFEKKSE